MTTIQWDSEKSSALSAVKPMTDGRHLCRHEAPKAGNNPPSLIAPMIAASIRQTSRLLQAAMDPAGGANFLGAIQTLSQHRTTTGARRTGRLVGRNTAAFLQSKRGRRTCARRRVSGLPPFRAEVRVLGMGIKGGSNHPPRESPSSSFHIHLTDRPEQSILLPSKHYLTGLPS